MTPQYALIMVFAGMTSVVLLAAGLLGGLAALPLLILSPLPIAIASLGWGTLPGLGAAAMGIVCVFFLSRADTAFLYAAAFALPVAYLSHLIGLSRQDDPDEPEEWFPLAEILFRTSLIGGVVLGLAFLITNFEIKSVTEAALSAFEETLQPLDAATQTAFKDAIALQVRLTPYSMPAAWLLMIWLNLWLGAKIVTMSKRLNRPAFAFGTSDMPFYTVLALGVGLLVSFTAEPLSHVGASLVGAFGMAFVIMGCVTLHMTTRHLSARVLLLTLLYLGIVLFGFPLLVVAGLGLADLIFKIRQRYVLTYNP